MVVFDLRFHSTIWPRLETGEDWLLLGSAVAGIIGHADGSGLWLHTWTSPRPVAFAERPDMVNAASVCRVSMPRLRRHMFSHEHDKIWNRVCIG